MIDIEEEGTCMHGICNAFKLYFLIVLIWELCALVGCAPVQRCPEGYFASGDMCFAIKEAGQRV